jgi:hypothetical protein
MSDEGQRRNAAQAWRGAHRLSSAGATFAAQRQARGGEIAAASAGRPWGHDNAGQAFDQRYRTVERQVLDAWEQLAAYVESLGEAAARSVQDHWGDDLGTPASTIAALTDGEEP